MTRAVASAPALFFACAALVIALAAPAYSVGAPPGATTSLQHLCARAHAGSRACFAVRKVRSTGTGIAPAAATPTGYGPADIQSAYKIPAGLGAGKLVAIVDAFDLPTAEADLATYRSNYGLPPCTTANGCFRKINQNGGTTPPASNDGWGGEIALDIDMVSATCPMCKILLVEANSASNSDLGKAVNQAAAQGAVAISNSYGGPESSSDPNFDNLYYKHAGIAVTASSGDDGFGTSYPSDSPYVTSVGGTSLTRASNSRGWSETVWNGAGSGCSAQEPKPAFQHDTGCAKRTMADVAAVADPNTGVAVYDSFGTGGGWNQYGGTSASSPIIASVYAMATPPAAGAFPVQYPYGNSGALFDVTSGSNGSCGGSYLCTGTAGYDGPTGLGTPNGVGAFGPVATGDDFSIATSPLSGSVAAGSPATTTVSTAVTSGAAQTVNLSASGLPSGASASFSPSSVTSGGSSTLTISTSASTPIGTSSVTITGTGTAATHSTSYSLTVTNGSGGVANGGFETGDLTAWTPSGAAEAVTTITPRSGTYADRGGLTTPTNGDSNIVQTFTVPTGFATLSFWYKMSCPDTVTYDWATATLRDNTTGVTTVPLPKTCATNASYVQVTAPVTADHTYTLTLTSHDDDYATDPSFTNFDDVTLVGAPGNDFSISVNPASGTVTAGGAVTTTVNTAVTSGSAQTVSLSASGLPSGASASFTPGSVTAGSGSSLKITTSTSTPAGTYPVTITGSATSGSHTTSFSLTVNPVTTCAAGQKLGNPGFESGATVWSASAGVIAQNGASQPTHGGTWNAWLDGYGRTHTDTLSQSVTIPSGCTNYTLSFWLHIDTSETTTSIQYDKLTVKLGSTTLATYSNLNKAAGYTQRSFNVASLAGQTVTLTFTGTEDVSLQTSFVIDDAALTVS